MFLGLVNNYKRFILPGSHLLLQLEVAMSELVVRLGKRIRELRSAENLTQDKFAEKVGISSKYLGEVERGEANVSIQILENIANALSADIGVLLDNAHWAERNLLIDEMRRLMDSASDAQVRIMHRIVSDVVK
jgi:transcriptional regulator with XRE-family HTH domain